MAISVASLDPFLATVLAGEWLLVAMDAEVVFEARDPSKRFAALWEFACPDFIHATCSLVSLKSH